MPPPGFVVPTEGTGLVVGIALAVALLVLVGCSGQPPAPSSGPPSGAAGTSAQATAVPAFAASLRPKLEEIVRTLRVPGAIVLVDVPGQGTWLTGMGVGNLDTNTPIQVTDHMRIGSITKTFTATVVLQLVDEHKLGLDDPVSTHLPAVPNGSNITVRQLLNMTSGLFDYTQDDGFNQLWDAQPGRVWTDRELLAYAFAHRPYFPPGQGFRYSNTNYELLGMIAVKLGGAPLAELMKRRIFDKLGMTSTSLPARDSAAIPDPHQRGYNYGTNVQTNNALQAALAGDKAAAQIPATPQAKPTDVTDWNVSWGPASGAAISTARDLQIWVKALATGQLLSPATHREQLRFGAASNYGLGVIRGTDGVIWHDGIMPGWQAFLGYEPGKNVTIIVLTNLQVAPNTYFIDGFPADSMARLIRQQLLPGR